MDMCRKKDGFKNERLLVLPMQIVNMISKNPLTKNLYITDIGFFPNAKFHFIERKEGINQNILIYCTKGEGFVIINDKKQQIIKNSLLVIPKNSPHVYGSSTDNPWDIYWIHFNGELASHYLPDEKNITLTATSLSSFSVLTNLFNDMFEALLRGYTINNIIYACQCFGFFLASAFYLPYNKYEYQDKQVQYIENSIGYMEKNINNSLTLKDLVSFNGLSKSQLTEIFKNRTGYSPIDFYIRLKIQKACSYLDLTDLTISEISLNVGYNDQYYFSRMFKKIMGMSPANYRKIKKG